MLFYLLLHSPYVSHQAFILFNKSPTVLEKLLMSGLQDVKLQLLLFYFNLDGFFLCKVL